MSVIFSNQQVQEPPVACVLVAWNNWAHTEQCLRALMVQDYGRLLVIVVDNGSADESVTRIRAAYPSVICIEAGYNSGFAKACNTGARRGLDAGAEFIWFLNNDTEAPPDTVRKLVSKAISNPQIGLVGAVLFYMHQRTWVQAWGGGSVDLWSGFNHHFIAPASFGRNAYITFASALVRRQTFEDLGGLWEGLFLYFEDTDFSLRAVHAGWTLAVAEDTSIFHTENGSVASGQPRRRSRHPLLERIKTASAILFLRRHSRMPVVSIGIFLALRLGKRFALRDWPALRGVIDGVGDSWQHRLTPFRESA